jgi:Holliday junction resolvase RusA-like endonuclease
LRLGWLTSPMLSLFIPGPAVAKGRPKFAVHGGRARAYTPAKTMRYEQLVAHAAGLAMNGAAPAECAVVVSVTAYLAVPKSYSKRKTADALAGVLRPTTKPDVDNYLKIALDGLNGIAFRDDAQVICASVSKQFATAPGLHIEVTDGAE